MIPGEISHVTWSEARSSFVRGNFIAVVMLCQGLAEHVLASQLSMGLDATPLPTRVQFKDTLKRSVDEGVISEDLAEDLKKLMSLRNPLSHYRDVNDASNISRRAIDTAVPPHQHLLNDATFAISVIVRRWPLLTHSLAGV